MTETFSIWADSQDTGLSRPGAGPLTYFVQDLDLHELQLYTVRQRLVTATAQSVRALGSDWKGSAGAGGVAPRSLCALEALICLKRSGAGHPWGRTTCQIE